METISHRIRVSPALPQQDHPGEGEKREQRINSFSVEARLAPEMDTGGTWLINAAWSPAGTEIGVTLKSKHRQPNE